jgi:hypothetical protein
MSGPEKLDLLNKIHSSAGMVHLNRKKQRSFSFNIFLENSQELLDITYQVRDPGEGLRLWNVLNREENDQTHRVVNRRFHNFLAAAKTLVDHTREFIREHYGLSSFMEIYGRRVSAEFQDRPVIKFVEDFRNYMLHRGLPPSSMFLHIENNPEAGEGANIVTGVHYDTSALLEWSGWTAPAKQYLADSGTKIEIHTFVNEYINIITNFHQWLDSELDGFHADDLRELWKLQAEFQESYGDDERKASPEAPPIDFQPTNASSESIQFEFPPTTEEAIDKIGTDLVVSIIEFTPPASEPDKFKTLRPVTGPVIPIETPIAWARDANGESVLVFIESEIGAYGLGAEGNSRLVQCIDQVLSVNWARSTLSRKFIEGTILRWCRSSFCREAPESLSRYITSIANEKVKELKVWIPIANLEIESALKLGPVEIAPTTPEMIDALEARATSGEGEKDEGRSAFFRKLREEIQGFAAVSMSIRAEPEHAWEACEPIARDAVSLLRFICPAAGIAKIYIPVSLLGSEIVPAFKVLVFGDQAFSFKSGFDPQRFFYWKLPSEHINFLKEQGLTKIGELIDSTSLSDFEGAIRSSLIIYSTGISVNRPGIAGGPNS